MSYEIDFKLRALQSTTTEKHLDDLITKLKEINTLATNKGAKGGVLNTSELKKIKELLKDVNKESAKTSKEVKETNSEYNKRVEILKAEIKQIITKQKGLSKSKQIADEMMKTALKDKKITQEQYLTLKKAMLLESDINKKKTKALNDTIAKNKTIKKQLSEINIKRINVGEIDKANKDLIKYVKTLDLYAKKLKQGKVLNDDKIRSLKELDAIQRQTAKKIKGTAEVNTPVETLKAEIRLQDLKDKKLKDSVVLATKYVEIVRSGKKLTEQQVLELKKLENTEKKILATKKKDTVAKEKEKLVIAKQLHDLKMREITLGERDIFNTDQNKYINQMKEYNRQLLAGNRLTEQQVRDLRVLDATQRNNIRTQDTVVSNLATIRMAYTSLAKVMRVVSASTRKISEIDKSMFNLGVVTGKTSYEIEGLRTRMLEIAHDGPISGSALADSADLIARTGCRKSARCKKSFFMLGSLKVA